MDSSENNCQILIKTYHDMQFSILSWCSSGTSPGFGRGGPRMFFPDLEAMRFARGVRGHGPPRKFFKMVRFGVYFDHILFLKNFKNYHFLYKKFKNCNFLYKRINVLDARLLWGNYSREEIF